MMRDGWVRDAMRGLLLATLLCGAVWSVAQAQGRPNDFGRSSSTAGAGPDEESDSAKRARIRLDLAGAYFSEGRFDNALSEVKLALAADPNLPQALNLQGLVLAALGEEQKAEDSFKRALQLASTDGDVMHNYGWFLCQRGRYPEAGKLFERAVATPQYRTPNRTFLVQGICEARAGQLDLAETTLKRAYELEPANPAIAMNLADVLYRRGEYERARFYVRRVNNNAELRSAETLWLAARIENRLANPQGVRDLGNQLRASYPTSREAASFERGMFDE
ncbi:type IV pilus biogenesis/stability protein PilW [Methylibium petroleiphilum]|uniref:type IV pilus biogenesis/stability protein PilW n=1 Tax=Methylibium petroleiphilum TaxID=105560 RepID=UPI002351FF70|nr:type IV pilus biogenesis/stability protein PilW [Methylibium petroleiphilum]